MSAFLDNAREIFNVACSSHDAPNSDFALLIGHDGGLHIIMESAFYLEAASLEAGSRAAYRVTRSQSGVKVTGTSLHQKVVLEDRSRNRSVASGLLPDQPLYRINSPVFASA